MLHERPPDTVECSARHGRDVCETKGVLGIEVCEDAVDRTWTRVGGRRGGRGREGAERVVIRLHAPRILLLITRSPRRLRHRLHQHPLASFPSSTDGIPLKPVLQKALIPIIRVLEQQDRRDVVSSYYQALVCGYSRGYPAEAGVGDEDCREPEGAVGVCLREGGERWGVYACSHITIVGFAKDRARRGVRARVNCHIRIRPSTTTCANH